RLTLPQTPGRPARARRRACGESMREARGGPRGGPPRVLRPGARGVRVRRGGGPASILPRRLRRSRGPNFMIGTELLDDPRADPVAVDKELHDIARLNALFGGTRAVVRELEPFFERSERETWTLLDIGTGAGDIPR